MSALRLALMIGAVAIPVSAGAETIAFTGGTVAIGDGSAPVSNGTVVMTDGRIVAAGANVRVPGGATIVDATGKWVTPGLVAGYSGLGLSEVDLSADGTTDDAARNGPFSAAIDVAPAINPKDTPIAVNRADGVTRAVVAPSSAKSIFSGQGAMIDLGADNDPITRARLFQVVELGETGADLAGGSRASAYVLLRNALREAGELRRFATPLASRATARAAEPPSDPNESSLTGPSAKRSDDVLLTRFDAAALVPVLQGRQLLIAHVERASDILQVLKLKREFPALKLAILGASEGWTVAADIAAAHVPVIIQPLTDLPESFEELASTQSNAGRMVAAGVLVSIGLGDTRMLFNARQYAGNLVALGKVPGATGVSWGEALAMVSSRAAQAVGMGGEVGSLTPGKHGDVVLWSGDPLEGESNADAVWIDGVRQPLDTHQTKLRDRYLDLTRRELPPAYRR